MADSAKNGDAADLAGAAREALATLPGVRPGAERGDARRVDRGAGPVISAKVGGRPPDILIAVKANAYPRSAPRRHCPEGRTGRHGVNGYADQETVTNSLISPCSTRSRHPDLSRVSQSSR
ncbi:MAG: hypothetical protein IT306_09980 [Chloroflexi bacterium]|nr:hypothetical protein [Chloroflexota bacterium]